MADGVPLTIRLIRVNVPLIHHHSSLHGSETLRDLVLIEWTDAHGSVGWSECSTLNSGGYVTETTSDAWEALRSVLVPSVMNGYESHAAGIVAAPAALRDAALDSRLRRKGVALCDFLGGVRVPLARCVVIADVGAGPDAVSTRAEAAVAAGAEMVKVKIGGPDDRRIVESVVATLGDVPVAVDANGAYRRASDVTWLDDLELAYVEQPFSSQLAVDEMAAQTTALRTPVALDESLLSVEALVELADAGAMEAVSIKPLRMGGCEKAAEAVALARSKDLDVFVGGMVELGIGRAASLAVATLPGCTLPTDLGPSGQYFVSDVTYPIEVDPGGFFGPPLGPGIGIAPETELLDRFVVDEVSFHQ